MKLTDSNEKAGLCPEENLFTGLDEIVRLGAQQMLQAAIEHEVQLFLEKYKHLSDEQGHRLAVRNGYMPERDFLTPAGPVKIKQPRIDDRKLRKQYGIDFTSEILPKYLRKSPNLNNLIPVLYLKGISTNDFPPALSAILGDEAKGLSASTISRLKESWNDDFTAWEKRDLSDKRYVYLWADGIYFNARMQDARKCALVIIGVTEKGKKELVAVYDGIRESKLSWKDVLLDLKNRGLEKGPELAIGDGSLGFWAALAEIYPECKRQRCWVHKTANILDKLPKSLQPNAKKLIHDIYLAPTHKEAEKAYGRFVELYQDKYPKATDCLTKDKEDLFTFFNYPAKHWQSIRTTNPIESTFATVRLRTAKTRNCYTNKTVLMMVYKLLMEAEKKWRKLRGFKDIILVMNREVFIDGIIKRAS